MKIERKEPEFQPITITIETQDELDQMFAMAEYCSFSNSEGGDITSLLFDGLWDKVVKTYESESEFSIIFK